MLHRSISSRNNKSFFLFGPRQVGKTTLIKSWMSPADLYINLLPQRAFLDYANEPGRFRDEVLSHCRRHRGGRVFVDEVQKLPALLDEVHDLIESQRIRFVLTGSSARKLRRGASNLLAGRAYTEKLYPLTFLELGLQFNLERALKVGCLPALWDEEGGEDPVAFLSSYAETYLHEEIAAEGLVKSLAPFARFLDVAAANDGEIVNFSSVARECAVSVKTAQSYYAILEDTFLALRLSPWLKSARKRLVAHPRYYFFDMGVTNALAKTLGSGLNPVARGRRFEQFVITQTRAIADYQRLDFELSFWRTNTGTEVDLVLSRGGAILAGIEIKSTSRIDPGNLTGLKALKAEHPNAETLVVGLFEKQRDLEQGIRAWPWGEFLRDKLSAL